MFLHQLSRIGQCRGAREQVGLSKTGTGSQEMQQFVLTGWTQHVFSGKGREQHAAENREAKRLTAIQKC